MAEISPRRWRLQVETVMSGEFMSGVAWGVRLAAGVIPKQIGQEVIKRDADDRGGFVAHGVG